MNVEFIKIDDNITAVSDEEGKIEKRDVGREILLIENKIEMLDEYISYLNADLKEKKTRGKSFKIICVEIFITILIGIGMGLITLGIYSLPITLIIGFLLGGIPIGIFINAIKKNSKRIAVREKQKAKAIGLRTSCENDLAEKLDLENKVEKEISLNEVVTLEKDNALIRQEIEYTLDKIRLDQDQRDPLILSRRKNTIL